MIGLVFPVEVRRVLLSGRGVFSGGDGFEQTFGPDTLLPL